MRGTVAAAWQSCVIAVQGRRIDNVDVDFWLMIRDQGLGLRSRIKDKMVQYRKEELTMWTFQNQGPILWTKIKDQRATTLGRRKGNQDREAFGSGSKNKDLLVILLCAHV